jgi:hypothetical protein
MGQLFGVEQGGDPILKRRIDGDVGAAPEICTAGSSPNRLGSAKSGPIENDQADQQIFPPGY